MGWKLTLINGVVTREDWRLSFLKSMSLSKKIVRKKNELFRMIKLSFLLTRYKIRKNANNLDYNNIDKVLLLRLDDKIGDMVVATGVIKSLFDRNIKVYLLTGPLCANLLADSEYVEKIFIYQRRHSLNYLTQECFDVVIDFDDVVTYERCNLIHKISAKNTIGFNKKNVPVYNQSIEFFDENQHVTERHARVLQLFGVTGNDYGYYVPISQGSIARVEALLCSLNYRRLIAINPLTGSDDKDLSSEQVQQLVDHIKNQYPDDQVILIGIDKKISSLEINDIIYVKESTVNTAAEIIRRADVIISPDTSIVHMCRAFNKPLLAIYNKRKLKDTGMVGYKIWAPNYPSAFQLVIEQEYISQLPFDMLKDEFDRVLKNITA